MLTRLVLKNLTVFSEADFVFEPGLNVVVGENGTGKSHLLKAADTVAADQSGLSQPNRVENLVYLTNQDLPSVHF
jgi:DNA repair ATPase RecN